MRMVMDYLPALLVDGLLTPNADGTVDAALSAYTLIAAPSSQRTTAWLGLRELLDHDLACWRGTEGRVIIKEARTPQ